MATPSSGTYFPKCNLNDQELMVPLVHRYVFHLQLLLQGRRIGPVCSYTLGIRQNIHNKLLQRYHFQMTHIANVFRSAEVDWLRTVMLEVLSRRLKLAVGGDPFFQFS